ncbi:hypothetical protein FAP59_16665 [Morganella morganii]|nr:hypothetical protein [Morganella morganii]
MSREIEKYEECQNKAIDMVNNGFSSLACKKRALAEINRAYEYVRDHISNVLLDVRLKSIEQNYIDKINDIYYDIPMYCHNYRQSHEDKLLELIPENKDIICLLMELQIFRTNVNNISVIKPENNNAFGNFKIEKYENLKDKMERLKKQYDHALSCAEFFGGLPVTSNIHLCINQHGTRYVRAFFYLDGKLTPLRLIMAAMEEAKRKGFIKEDRK